MSFFILLESLGNLTTNNPLSNSAWTSEIFIFSDLLEVVYRTLARKRGKSRWGDKTPFNTFNMRELIKAFPNAQFIHIVRDGRDVHLSWREVDWCKGRDVRTSAEKWRGWVWSAYRPGKLLNKEKWSF